MGQTFVYNAGKHEVEETNLELTFGVFIDGTLNNKTNKEMRDKYGRGGEHGDVNKELSNKEIEDNDEEAYNNLKRKDKKRIKELQAKEKLTEEEKKEFDGYEKERYLMGSHREHLYEFGTDHMGTNNSYSNDYTNVARMWTCCNRDYKIYVEGMGTDQNLRDTQDGFAFGSGKTGIRSRVRNACEQLADKIKKEKKKKENGKKILTQITLDVFGFSRGAAAARNFVYEVNKKKMYKATWDDKIPNGVVDDGEGGNIQLYRRGVVDDDKLLVESAGMLDMFLPRMGHLGYCLLKNNAITLDELLSVKIVIRFLGIYETVSSYYERGERVGEYDKNGKWVDDDFLPKGINKSWYAGKPKDPFYNNTAPLHLNDFGSVTQIVHFTAQDEHRVNFDLTRMPGANIKSNQDTIRIVERNFPGVHCDIGGAYENEDEIQEQIETSEYVEDLEQRMQELIDESWFDDEQLTIDGKTLSTITKVLKYASIGATKALQTYKKMNGIREKMRKEYSYIPLHYMEEYAMTTAMQNYITSPIVDKYPLNDDFLENVKGYMSRYAFDVTGEVRQWSFKSDAQIESEYRAKEANKAFLESMKPPQKPIPYVNESDEVPVIEECPPETDPNTTQLEEVVVIKHKDQEYLRKLRGEYLHWSATRKWFGMEPQVDRKRVEHPKK